MVSFQTGGLTNLTGVASVVLCNVVRSRKLPKEATELVHCV